ncbi:VanZ family protein [Paenibacillus sp. CF384]|uniref:VanZ family protein n=1 Tax=Paenibacillus sp. CF384 TaxID=1884382 RepID=UPI00089BFCC1|nr:VanZ family protein [Paenibacillus sp. CF384]SDX65907.1 VanZ like family protein [Paenibacillus sp. CF384]
MSNKGRRYMISLIVVVCWIAFIFIFSSQSYQEQSIQPVLHRLVTENALREVLPDVTFHYHHRLYSSHGDPYLFIEFLFRKGAHLFMYGVLSIGAAIATNMKNHPARRWPIPLFIVLMIASLDELNQRVSPGRTSNSQDVLVDITGGCIGLFVYLAGSYFGKRMRRGASL